MDVEEKKVGRPRKADEDCSPACRRKRVERERKRAVIGDKQFNEEAAEKSKAYRAKKKEQYKASLEAVGEPTQGTLTQRASLEKARRQIMDTMNKTLNEFYDAKVKSAAEVQAKGDTLIARALQEAKKRLINISTIANKEEFAQRLFKHSKDHETGKNTIRKYRTARQYITRMLQLQRMVNPDANPEVLDLKNFENIGRVIDAVENGKAADGTP